MAIDVIIAQGEEVIRRWVENPPTVKYYEWQEASRSLARRAKEQRDFRSDVFLCLKGDNYLGYDFDYEFCRALAEAAGRYCWGAKLYVAVDDGLDLNKDQLDNIPHLVTWLDELHEGRRRPTDILLARFASMPPLYFYHGAD